MNDCGVSQGCAVVYRYCVRPLLNANEQRIDTTIDRLHFATIQAGAEIRDVSSEVFHSAVQNFGASLFVSALNAQAKAQAAQQAAAAANDATPPQSPVGAAAAGAHSKSD